MKWHYTKNGDKSKPIKNETIPCVIDGHHGYDLHWWDEYNDCWNDADDDDYACDFDGVERWAYIEDEKYEIAEPHHMRCEDIKNIK